MRRQSPREVHARQQIGRREHGGEPVHHAHGQLAERDHEQHAQRDECGFAQAVVTRLREQQRGRHDREDGDRAHVESERDTPRGPAQRFGWRGASAGCTLEARATRVDQVVPHVRSGVAIAIRPGGPARRVVRELDRPARDVALGERACPGDRLDDVPVAIARREVHRAVHAAGVFPQLVLDDAHRFDELAPVERAQQAQAPDRVADRNLGAGLLLRFGLHEVFDREPRLGQPLLDPRQGQRQGGALSLQAARELGHERAHHRRIRARHVGDDQDQALGVVHGRVQHLLGPLLRPVPVGCAGRDPHADTAQVLDQSEAQHDRNRPQLAEREGCHRLVGRDEPGQAVRVDAAVAVRDRLECEVVDARKAGGRTLGEAWKFAAVTLRQVSLRRADLLVDQVEIVDQPFRGGRDAAAFRHFHRQQVAHARQDRFVVGEARQQPVGRTVRGQPMRDREVPAVLFHLLDAEELRPQRRLFVDVLCERIGASGLGQEPEHLVHDGPPACVQVAIPFVSAQRQTRDAACCVRSAPVLRSNAPTASASIRLPRTSLKPFDGWRRNRGAATPRPRTRRTSSRDRHLRGIDARDGAAIAGARDARLRRRSHVDQHQRHPAIETDGRYRVNAGGNPAVVTGLRDHHESSRWRPDRMFAGAHSGLRATRTTASSLEACVTANSALANRRRAAGRASCVAIGNDAVLRALPCARCDAKVRHGADRGHRSRAAHAAGDAVRPHRRVTALRVSQCLLPRTFFRARPPPSRKVPTCRCTFSDFVRTPR